MSEKGKQGSSRRKGDEFQDLTALRLILELYISRTSFKVFLEYEGSGNLDDIVVVLRDEVVAYQVKYAVNKHEVYVPSDLISQDSPVSIFRFYNSRNLLNSRFPKSKITACLCSNRALDSELARLVNQNGAFIESFVMNRIRGDAKKIRTEIVAQFDSDETTKQGFLANFKFDVRQPSLDELASNIRTILLSEKLGLSDELIFHELKKAVVENALYSRTPISNEDIDALLGRLQSKLLVPQVFPVNEEHFVEQTKLFECIDEKLPLNDGGYLIVTGLPGSGKSTSLTSYFKLHKSEQTEVFSYYCFVRVNDSVQNIRIQAESLRANLLDNFHRQYPDILDRRFDYSENAFYASLEKLASYFRDKGKRFIILLDGLDHVERLSPEIKNSVIAALPADVPSGATIVIGTQELHTWPYFLKRTRENPASHIQMPLFSIEEATIYLQDKRGLSALNRAELLQIYQKCEGLPLYLRYAAEFILSHDSYSDAIAKLSPATGGNIRNYYDLLWSEANQVGKKELRHLCAVMACLRFPAHIDEIFSIQSTLTRPDFEDALLCMKHLLRDQDGLVTVFHDSFREYVRDQISDGWKSEILRGILEFLKEKKGSPRWYAYVFEYAMEQKEYDYIVEEVTEDFISQAISHCRPSNEIHKIIETAQQAAYELGDVVQVSRLGTLASRTQERLEHNLDYALLADTLTALGRVQDVISFAFSPEGQRWLVDQQVALSVMATLADQGRFELGTKLFDVFTAEFTGINTDNRFEERALVVGIAQCLAAYETSTARSVRWLSYSSFSVDGLIPEETFAPGYEPHLEAYIDKLVSHGHDEKWKRLLRIKRLFDFKIVYYLVIRSLAKHGKKDALKSVISEYIDITSLSCNSELAFYAALAEMDVSLVSSLAGPVAAPMLKCPDYINRGDPKFLGYGYSFTVIGYEGSQNSYDNLISSFSASKTLWSSALAHTLNSGWSLGQYFRGIKDGWYEKGIQSIDDLLNAKQGEGERICDSIDVIRNILPFTIVQQTHAIAKCHPTYLDDWFKKLAGLRKSMLWTVHYGISESRVDYDFELSLWDSLADIEQARIRLRSILTDCAETYREATKLKGSCRFSHFTWLAKIMAKCGMQAEAERCLAEGIAASLVYGYHKDVTLSCLIDVMRLVNRRQPTLALQRCSRVLEMVKWMPHLTDGRETKWFVRDAFSAVLEVNSDTALDLLGHFAKTIARWKTLDCLEKYITQSEDGDVEYLWCATTLFYHLSNDRKECPQIIKCRKHLLDRSKESFSNEYQDLSERYDNFIHTEITPRHWPTEFRDEYAGPLYLDESNGRNSHSEQKEKLELDGKPLTEEMLNKAIRMPFNEFLEHVEDIKKANGHSFYERDWINKSIDYHVDQARTCSELDHLLQYAEKADRWHRSAKALESLGDKYLSLGNEKQALECYELAYACDGDWFRWKNNSKYLSLIAKIDENKANKVLLRESRNSDGYNVAPLAAWGLDAIDDEARLESVFSDYLEHCERLFKQMPSNDEFAWLAEHKQNSTTVNLRILRLVLNELDTPEIDHGKRYIQALAKLGTNRPDCALPIIVNEALHSEGLKLYRLLGVLQCVCAESPELISEHQENISTLLKQKDFLVRISIIEILKRLAKLTSDASSLKNRAEFEYSPTLYHSTYRLTGEPTAEFMHFLRSGKGALFDFYDQIMLLEKYSDLPSGCLLATIEKTLKGEGWSIEEEHEQLRDDWYSFVHPQGWPVVWIYTQFQQRVSKILWSIIHEIVEASRFTPVHVAILARIALESDHNYIINGVAPRPDDIAPLSVRDKDLWLGSLAQSDSLQVFTDNNKEWITVYDGHQLSFEEKYKVPYQQVSISRGYLIPAEVYKGHHEIDQLELFTERIVPERGFRIDFEFAYSELCKRNSQVYDPSDACLSLIALYENPNTFNGHKSICLLSSFIIDEFGLALKGCNLFRGEEQVTAFETWQEGYQDEEYTREKLSYGSRLKVKKTFLQEICARYGKVLCINTLIERRFWKSMFSREPEETTEKSLYELHYIRD